MQRKPRNAHTDRLADWRFFIQVYLVRDPLKPRKTISLTSCAAQFVGLMMWPCCMGMWFLYMHQQGFGFYDVLLVYNKWTDGYKGFSTDQLTRFVSVGQCILCAALLLLRIK